MSRNNRTVITGGSKVTKKEMKDQSEKQNIEIEDLNGKLIILARLYKGHAERINKLELAK